MTVTFELAGQQFHALNGGPAFQFNEAGCRGAAAGLRQRLRSFLAIFPGRVRFMLPMQGSVTHVEHADERRKAIVVADVRNRSGLR